MRLLSVVVLLLLVDCGSSAPPAVPANVVVPKIDPSAALDPAGAAWLQTELAAERTAGRTVVLVTHELESLYSIADRMLFLDGEAHRPVALGAPAELARHAESAKVRDFLAGVGQLFDLELDQIFGFEVLPSAIPAS